MRGFIQNVVIAVVGVLVLIGIVMYSTETKQAEPAPAVTGVSGALMPEKGGVVISTATPPLVEPPTGTPPRSAPAPTPPKPVITPPPKKPAATPPTPTTITPPTPTPAPVPGPEPAPVTPWSPGFMASTRVTSEIPSENERATLPSCDGKVFIQEPVNMAVVTSIHANGSTHGGAPYDYAIFELPTKGTESKYDLVAPADVYVTNIVQETGISSDPDDTTIYFALCRDVIGYVTHVKELSTQTYKMITDSLCFGKAQTGPNACHIQILSLIGQGSALGRVGRTEGSFGFGVIDLRTQRALSGPASYPIRTNYAACFLSYFKNPQNFLVKFAGSTDLCVVP